MCVYIVSRTLILILLPLSQCPHNAQRKVLSWKLLPYGSGISHHAFIFILKFIFNHFFSRFFLFFIRIFLNRKRNIAVNQLRTHCDLPVLMQQVMVCTGFEQGSSYSGDLKDAQKAIPSGTLWAVVITSIVCILYAELICSTCGDRSLVRTEQFLFFFFFYKQAIVLKRPWA